MYDKGYIKWRNDEYKVGTGVFLKSDTYSFKNNRDIETGDSVSILEIMHFSKYMNI